MDINIRRIFSCLYPDNFTGKFNHITKILQKVIQNKQLI